LKQFITDKARQRFQEKLENIANPDLILEFEKVVILRAVDTRWTDHIDAMDQLRQGVGLRAYAQNNPLVEYQTEGYERFNDMISGIEYDAS
ncbi:preprotein translocase subunit SecA, partial [Streptococcus anginosus]|nr:preprotein translocase subunit SecA [Streptococcus anginosus]